MVVDGDHGAKVADDDDGQRQKDAAEIALPSGPPQVESYELAHPAENALPSGSPQVEFYELALRSAWLKSTFVVIDANGADVEEFVPGWMSLAIRGCWDTAPASWGEIGFLDYSFWDSVKSRQRLRYHLADLQEIVIDSPSAQTVRATVNGGAGYRVRDDGWWQRLTNYEWTIESDDGADQLGVVTIRHPNLLQLEFHWGLKIQFRTTTDPHRNAVGRHVLFAMSYAIRQALQRQQVLATQGLRL